MAATIARKRVVSRDDLIQAVRETEELLRGRGITAVYLASSEEPASLVELVVDYDQTYPFTLITLVEIEHHLRDLLGRNVEITTLDALKAKASDLIVTSGNRIF